MLVILLVAGAALLYFIMFVLSVLDDLSIYIFKKPLYIHLYFRKKEITLQEQEILKHHFPFYSKLSQKQQSYFQHRVASFNEKYRFIARDEFELDIRVQTMIAGTFVMLTFGMRNYLMNSFDKIIIYPEQYLSTHSEEYFKGEFNPRMKAVVFSCKDFIEGYEISNDNLNLGIHEFSHAVHFHSLRSTEQSAVTFKKYYEKIIKEVNHLPNRERLINSNYFRIYAYTNQFEFISVIIEHYFETPESFKTEFPELFQHVSRMLNLKN